MISFGTYRGRLINPFLVRLYLLDTAGTSIPPTSGGYSQGYDPDFREPVVAPPVTLSGVGDNNRKELAYIEVPAQVEVKRHDALAPASSGNNQTARIICVFHFMDLERLSLLDTATNKALIKLGDRLDSVYEMNGTLVQQWSPNLFCIEAAPELGGLGKKRNLHICTFEDRSAI